ncbi:MAG TPA: hypothetical protein VEE84_01950 [Burkholderiaceae bacterium]|nr:hypothetical protein [Burkholderiaceae bacterium]
MPARLPIWLAVFAIAAVVVGCAIPNVRHFLLRSAGWALVASDPEEPADIIVIAVDAGAPEDLEAADLVHRGISARVAVFAQAPDPLQPEYARRGLPPSSQAPRSVRLLNALGIRVIEQIAQTPEGTDDEARILAEWCERNGFRTVIFVSTADHSRRARRILGRSMLNHRTRILVRYSPYASFHPDAWWRTRDGLRTELVEMEKLLADLLLHPLPAN